MKNLTIIIFLLANMSIFAQTTYVPDDNFEQALIDLGYDDVLDDYVPTANVNTLTFLDVSYKNIADLTGIEDFTSLNILFCESNQLTDIDISANTALTDFFCNSNQLTSLDISANTSLTNLECESNQIADINISENTALTDFNCKSNELISLDISANTSLTHLNCASNNLTNIDLAANASLVSLHCYSNQLASIDVSANVNLEYLYCASNYLTSLDVLSNPSLMLLYCASNQLTNISISDVNTDLTVLSCEYNQLTSIDISDNNSLNGLVCNSNNLTSLDVRNGNNTNFTYFNSENNPNLICIFVDDATWSQANWTNIDANSTFVETEAECDALAVEYVANSNFMLYPNPTKNYFSINTSSKIKSVEIYDVFGKLLQVFENQNTYPVSNLAKGVYLIHAKTENGVFVSKLIVE